MKPLAIVALGSALLTACNADLKSEKLALVRLAEQKQAVLKLGEECREKVGLDQIHKDEEAASAKCKPLADALRAINVADTTDANRRAWLVAYNRRKSDPSCQEEDRLRDLWTERYKDVERCEDKDERSKEYDVRKAEYLAACQKCAIKERCEKVIDDNVVAYMVTHNLFLSREPKPEEREAFEKWKAKHSTIFYACEK